MRKFLCKFFGIHTPDRSLNINMICHCKYCGEDIVKIQGVWRSRIEENIKQEA